MHLVAALGCCEVLRYCPSTRLLEAQRLPAGLHAHVALLAPVFTPRVPNDPIHSFLWVGPPTDNRDDVVCEERKPLGDARGVVEDRARIDAAGDRASVEDLLHHCILPRNRTVVGDRRIRVARKACTWRAEVATCPCDILGFAMGVHLPAEALATLRRACQVRLRCEVRDARAGFAQLVDPLVGAIDAAAMARACVSAIQHVLNRQHDVSPLGLARNLDAICESGGRAPRPARPAVLRNVLVHRLRAIVHPILVAPREALRVSTIRLREVVMRGVLRGIPSPHDSHCLHLLPRQQLAAMLRRRGLRDEHGSGGGGSAYGALHR
mmetsp:Transcript_25036/g.62779  ORF Transcript_25036/g.62779 Transcript_25036/m.62779 type:complete len:323 (-) Transcript_25036:82-1050(-)